MKRARGHSRLGESAPWGGGNLETWCPWWPFELGPWGSCLQISGSHGLQPPYRASSFGPHTWAAGSCQSPDQSPRGPWLRRTRMGLGIQELHSRDDSSETKTGWRPWIIIWHRRSFSIHASHTLVKELPGNWRDHTRIVWELQGRRISWWPRGTGSSSFEVQMSNTPVDWYPPSVTLSRQSKD